MAVVATALTVTPAFDGTKRMTLTGAIAANEFVAVTIVGAADGIAGMVFRLVSQCGRVEYARFPSDTTVDVWAVSGSDLTCTLDMNTTALRAFFACRGPQETAEAVALLENGTTNNLYGAGRVVIRNWVQNPLDPVAGATQMQAQITTIAGLLETHTHDATVEGETAFPHNNLTSREVTGCHPTIENNITALGASVEAAITASEAAAALTALIKDGGTFSQVTGASTLGQVKTLLNQIVVVVNGWRSI